MRRRNECTGSTTALGTSTGVNSGATGTNDEQALKVVKKASSFRCG